MVKNSSLMLRIKKCVEICENLKENRCKYIEKCKSCTKVRVLFFFGAYCEPLTIACKAHVYDPSKQKDIEHYLNI